MDQNAEDRKNPNEEFLESESKGFGDTGRKTRKDDDFLSKAQQKEFVRSEERKDTFQELLIKHLPCIFRTSLIIVFVIIIVRALHLVDGFGFARLVWIEKETLNMIDKILAFIFGIVITKYFPKVFPEKSS